MSKEQSSQGISIGAALLHVSGCIKRRGFIEGATVGEDETGITVTIRRIGQYRTPLEDRHHIAGAALTDPITEQMVSNFAIALRIGRVGERPGHNARALMSHTAMYLGLDGHYHITGMPDDATRPGLRVVEQHPGRRVA